jgi:hypothetical protein
MKRIWRYSICLLACITFFLGCPLEYPPSYHFVETRAVLYKTNIIGITGPVARQGEEYIEISYSAADDTRPGCNKTESIMVSLPYIFQNNRVYIQYDFYEDRKADEVIGYKEILLHDYGKEGAEYLRIINHSSSETVEYFFAGSQDMPDTIEAYETISPRFSFEHTYSVPSVRYKKAPMQYLLFPDRKPNYNFIYGAEYYTYEDNSCGEITLAIPWTVDMVNELYHAEYNRSAEIRLSVNYDDRKYDEPRRMIDMIEGYGVSDYEKSFAGKVFWGAIKPGGWRQNMASRNSPYVSG